MKWFLSIFTFLVLVSISGVYARTEILTWFLQNYAQKHDQDLQFEISAFTFNDLKLKNIRLNKKNVLPILDISYNIWSSDVLKKIVIDIDTIDVESLQDTMSKIGSRKQAKDPMAFEEAYSYCEKVRKIDLHVKWRELVVGSRKIPMQLRAVNTANEMQIEWNDKKNSQGDVRLNCVANSISLVSKRLSFEVKDTVFKEMKVADFSIKLDKAMVSWTAAQPLDWGITGTVDLNFSQNKQTYIFDIPGFDFKGMYNPDGSVSGEFIFPQLSLGSQKTGDQFSGLNLSGTFLKTAERANAVMRVRDQTKELFIDGLEVLQTADVVQIKTAAAKTIIKFNDQLGSFIPDSKKYLKSISGTIKLGSDLTLKSEKWSGTLHVIGENIACSSEYGDYEGVSFSHKVNSLETFSTPKQQFLKIKKINMGPGVDDLSITYQMPNLYTVEVSRFHARAGKGELFAENFTIFPQKKHIENFLAQVVNVDLETLLAIGLKDTVKAQGVLHGHLGISYEGKRPVFKGLLTDPKEGWIQYRTGNLQASGISLSDGPMEILNNYLYDFKYQNLSLRLSSDTNYDMKMTLAALGYNPSYLGGKPLKLNVNLEQNLLAAMQSVMLTYDLPNRIREKFEKVNE